MLDWGGCCIEIFALKEKGNEEILSFFSLENNSIHDCAMSTLWIPFSFFEEGNDTPWFNVEYEK